MPDKPDDIDEQHALLEAAHAERPDALLIAPAHATALNGTLRRMQADGIPILCFVSRPEEIACTCFVGSDDRALARGIADYLFDRSTRAATSSRWRAIPMPSRRPPRAAGFREAARARGNIRIVNSRPGYFLRDGGYAGMIELLAAQPRIDGVLAANDFMALGALDAMREAGRKIPIVGVNATPEGVQAIKAGDLLASASFDAMKMACLGVEAAIRVLSRRDRCRPRSCCPSRWSTAPTAPPGTCPTRSGRCRSGRTYVRRESAPLPARGRGCTRQLDQFATAPDAG